MSSSVHLRLKELLQQRASGEAYLRLTQIDNPRVHEFVADYVKLCNPAKIFVLTESVNDVEYIRRAAVEHGEESRLAIEGHTIHFENYYDQARDREHTLILTPKEAELGPRLRTADREERLEEIHMILENIMNGREMYICFYSLGPTNSEFSIPCIQITDSSYVAHSENLLYRAGYNELIRQGPKAHPFRFVHSEGELDERKTSRNLDKRRVYIDIESETVYSANTQYGGNTIGLKKLAMRLAINRASKEGWLCEHMLIMGIHGPKERITYTTGAFPSMCGKTSTAMMDGESIVGDDIAYLRKKKGEVRAVNVEKGIFGIIEGINSKDDPIQWQVLHNPVETIFSNILVTDKGHIHWVGKDGPVPVRGCNHSGKWWIGKKDDKGKEIPCSHTNARFTVELKSFRNMDASLDNPEGVTVGAIVYGGRDSDTSVPVEEAFDWQHGIIIKGASLESETTAATLGKEGVREFNPMSNLDFLSIPIGRYIQDNLEFGKGLNKSPFIFAVNYFLRDKNGRFLNEKTDKKIWFKWMELRVQREVKAITSPTGLMPLYEDLSKLFNKVLGRGYSKEDYVKQFTVRIPENLTKIERIKEIYREERDVPRELFRVLLEQKQRLIESREKYGDYISPFTIAKS